MSPSETLEQTQQRFDSYVAGKDPLELQRAAPATVARLIAGVPDAQLHRRPAPQKWCVLEIIAHLAEDELATSWRYRQMIEQPGVTLMGFNQDLWAQLGDYAAWNPRDALEMFRLLREANLGLLSRLTPEQWNCSGIHSERGPITVRSLARHMAAHDINHILQIEHILAGNGNSPD
jgi:DinB family protein